MVKQAVEEVALWCDLSTDQLRPLVPVPDKRLMFHAQCCGSASASAWIRMIFVSWIRIRNPHSRCGCRSGISYVKIVPMIKKLKFLNISLVYFKGKVQWEFSSVFLHVWIGLRLNKNRFWFRIFQNFWKSGLGLSIHVKIGSKISLDCPFKHFLYHYLLTIVQYEHESASASALRFFPGSASAFFRCGSATLSTPYTTLHIQGYVLPTGC